MNENQRRELLNEKKSGWLETSDEKFGQIFEFFPLGIPFPRGVL